MHCNSFNVISPLPFGLSPIAQIYVIFLLKQTSFARGELGTRIDRDISLIMPLRFVRQLRNNTAQSLVLIVKLDARCGRRLAPPTPNKQIAINSFMQNRNKRMKSAKKPLEHQTLTYFSYVS